jgi:hypothetical protein
MQNKILTIKYDNSLSLKPGADILDITDCNIPELREFNAFRIYCLGRLYSTVEYSGIVSPKFEKKTGLTIGEALNHIDGSADVFLFHPYPLELSLQNNFMQLAELEHPGITDRLSDLWRQIYGSELPDISLPENIKYCCHCNYFVANKKFWDMYSIVIDKINQIYTDGNFDRYIDDVSPYNLRTDSEHMVSFFPFMFERLLSHVLYTERDKFVVKNVSLDRDFNPVHVFKHEDKFVAFLRTIFLLDNKWLYGFKTRMATRIYYHFRKNILNIRRLVN